MASLQEEQRPIDLDIVQTLIAAVPESWRSATLQIERAPDAGKDESYLITIQSPEGRTEVVPPPVELMEAVRRLDQVFARHGHRWSKARYTITQADDGDWDFVALFDYE